MAAASRVCALSHRFSPESPQQLEASTTHRYLMRGHDSMRIAEDTNLASLEETE